MSPSRFDEENSVTNVQWRFPDGTVKEQSISDMEQLMFLLRMVGSVTIDGEAYRVTESTLIVDSDRLSVAVSLE